MSRIRACASTAPAAKREIRDAQSAYLPHGNFTVDIACRHMILLELKHRLTLMRLVSPRLAPARVSSAESALISMAKMILKRDRRAEHRWSGGDISQGMKLAKIMWRPINGSSFHHATAHGCHEKCRWRPTAISSLMPPLQSVAICKASATSHTNSSTTVAASRI